MKGAVLAVALLVSGSMIAMEPAINAGKSCFAHGKKEVIGYYNDIKDVVSHPRASLQKLQSGSFRLAELSVKVGVSAALLGLALKYGERVLPEKKAD